jgi:hypothetical protein
MNIIAVITSRDLEIQTLVGIGPEKEVKNPNGGVDSKILERILNSGYDKPFQIEFDDVKVFSRMSDAYPNPTLNHFVLARYLRDQGVRSRKVIDLGCGVGFLGNYGAVHLDPEVIVFSDLNPAALNQSANSYQLNNKIGLKSAEIINHKYGVQLKTGAQSLDLRLGNSGETLNEYDAQGCVSLCAPMYLPGICEVFPQAFQLFGLVAKNTGSTLYIGHSNLASDLVERAAISNGLHLNSKEEKKVPFSIEYTDLRNRRLCEGLVQKGLEIGVDGKVYHKLMVSQMSYKL